MSETTVAGLVRMANQIAANLAHEPDPARATADHMRLFWDPRMRRALLAHNGEGLSKVAANAVRLLGKG